jgi:hypothetical protein
VATKSEKEKKLRKSERMSNTPRSIETNNRCGERGELVVKKNKAGRR